MAWGASVIHKEVKLGVLIVSVRYTNTTAEGTTSFNEVYKTGKVRPNWIPDIVRDKIAQIEELETVDIPTGPVTPSDPVTPPASDPNSALFIRRMDILPFVQALVDFGIVPADHPKLLAYKNWVQSNLATYFDTFAG
jgi:hypothetical protein